MNGQHVGVDTDGNTDSGAPLAVADDGKDDITVQQGKLTEEAVIDDEMMERCGRNDQFCRMNFCVSEEKEISTPSSSAVSGRIRAISQDDWEYPDSYNAGETQM